MPFQSDKQRRYLWANEPEIAREWTDRYGARGGGIMDMASDGNLIHDFQNFKKGKSVNVPTSFQARSHSTPVNLAYVTPQEQGILQALKPGTPHEGPMGLPNYDDFDAAGNYRSGAAMSAAESGKHTSDTLAAGISNQELQDIRSGAIAAGAGQTVNPGWFGPRHRPGISKDDLRAAKRFAPKAYRATRGSPFGIGNLFRGAMSMFGGWPGKAMSLLSRIDPRQLRGKNPDGSWRTQQQYEDARTNRRNTKRMDYLSDRKSRGLGYGKKAYGDLLGQGYSDTFQDAMDADYKREGDDLYLQNPSKNYLSSIDLSKYDKAPLTNQLSANNYNFAPPTGTHYPGSYDENDYYTGTLSFEDQVARNKAKLESLDFTESADKVPMPDFMYNSPQVTEGLDNTMYGGDRKLVGSKDNINYYTGDTFPEGHPDMPPEYGITRYKTGGLASLWPR